MGPTVPAPFFKPRNLLSATQGNASPSAAAQQGLPPGVVDSVALKAAKVRDSALLNQGKARLDSAKAKAKADSARGATIR
jgi:hypothetical protein